MVELEVITKVGLINALATAQNIFVGIYAMIPNSCIQRDHGQVAWMPRFAYLR
jgi:hypothetical protein